MRKSWKKQWITELDERIPNLREDVLHAPIPTVVSSENATEKRSEIFTESADQMQAAKDNAKNRKKWSLTDKLALWVERFTARLKSKRRFVLRVTATAVASLVVCMVALIAFLPSAPTSGVGAFALEINPRAVFTVDENGTVTAVVAGNEDADVILSSKNRKNQMEGKPIADAMEVFVDYAARLGYLDLQSGDMIRLSVCDEAGVEQLVYDRLTAYFREKGLYVAVLTEKVSAQSFCARIGGISAGALNEIVESFETLPMLYTEREAEQKTVAELQTIYREEHPKEELKTTVEGLLNDVLAWITEREQSLQEIDDLNTQIKEHEENPAFLFKDYWSVKDFQDESEFTLRFSLLMQAMQILIEEHEQTYAVKIESEFDLKALQLEASSEFLHQLTELLADFSMEVFNGSTELLSMALRLIGVDVDLGELCEEPTTKADYVEKAKQYNEIRYRSLRTQGRVAYEEERTALTEEEYESFLRSICEKYGSLEGYWSAVNG